LKKLFSRADFARQRAAGFFDNATKEQMLVIAD